MRAALKLAQMAFDEGEIPIGAVVVAQDKIIAKGYNQVEKLQDPTAHAEILAITSACHAMGSKYLPDMQLYVTLEPCVMCAGAMHWAQISEVYFGAFDAKKGASLYQPSILTAKTRWEGGFLEEDCRSLVQLFFRNLRG